MSRGAAVLALVLATMYVDWPAPAFGRGHGASSHSSASRRGMSTAARAMAHAFASRRTGGSMVVTRPAPPFRHAPSGQRDHHRTSARILRPPAFLQAPLLYLRPAALSGRVAGGPESMRR